MMEELLRVVFHHYKDQFERESICSPSLKFYRSSEHIKCSGKTCIQVTNLILFNLVLSNCIKLRWQPWACSLFKWEPATGKVSSSRSAKMNHCAPFEPPSLWAQGARTFPFWVYAELLSGVIYLRLQNTWSRYSPSCTAIWGIFSLTLFPNFLFLTLPAL